MKFMLRSVINANCLSFLENEFQSLQLNFMAKYYLEFEDTEENKLCYTDIHNEYVSSACILLIFFLAHLGSLCHTHRLFVP